MNRDTALPQFADRARRGVLYLVPVIALVLLVTMSASPAAANGTSTVDCTDPAGDQYCPPYEEPCEADPAGDQYCPPYSDPCAANPAGDQYCPPYSDPCVADPAGDQYCPPYSQTCVRDGSSGAADDTRPATDGYCPPGYSPATGSGGSGSGGALPFTGADLALALGLAAALLAAGATLRRYSSRFGGASA